MKLVSYKANNLEHLGLVVENKIYNLAQNASILGKSLPDSMAHFLNAGDEAMKVAHQVNTAIASGSMNAVAADVNESALLAPVPHPT